MKNKAWFPKFEFVTEIPLWVIASDEAAYHPASRTIFVRVGNGKPKRKVILHTIHEVGHHLIELTLQKPKYHHKYDAIWHRIFPSRRVP